MAAISGASGCVPGEAAGAIYEARRLVRVSLTLFDRLFPREQRTPDELRQGRGDGELMSQEASSTGKGKGIARRLIS